jgi:cullin-associated NEDD8-dissociated protein 1
VRRLSLSALNAAARNKPHLIRDHLAALLPYLFAGTVINESLIRLVQMGPWQHKVDDGLEARKTAYETMYTLVSLAGLVVLRFSIICRLARHLPQ